MDKLVRATPVKLGDAFGEKVPEVNGDEILFNGHVPDDYETFHFSKQGGREFCKTSYKPYDLIVVACLAVAKDIFGEEIDVSSDGDHGDWEAGVAFASKVLGREIQNPIMKDRR
jgi:hypothetical protein